jgi:hypothetical protein
MLDSQKLQHVRDTGAHAVQYGKKEDLERMG